jgi:hypothetical protein
MKIAIVNIEGVLAETSNLLSSPPTKLAKDFYKAMKESYRVVLFSDQSDNALARSWLKKEGFWGFSMLMCRPENSAMTVPEWKINCLRGMLGDGWDIAMMVDSSRYLHEAVLAEGVAAMMVSYPTMARPGKLPENPGPVRSWDTIAATVEEANLLEQGG